MPKSNVADAGSASDLIDNVELDSLSGDKFAHNVLVDKLSSLVKSVPTPANIALFGPWGSGKSSIVGLLRSKLRRKEFQDHGIRVAKFDAFKYASSSFRRHLLRQVASEALDKKDAEKFAQSLYLKEESSYVDLSNLKRGHIWIVMAVILGGPVVFGILIGLVETLLQWAAGTTFGIAARSFVPVAVDTTRKVFGWIAIPAAAIGLVGSLLGSTLPIRRTVNQPTSEEEFEEKFKELLERVHCERLVVLVDELDRCSPRQVVDVLDALRTFLFVPRTLFVVAADQFVLEKALSIELSREFPMEQEVAPYTIGHSHLDKTFQYQLSIPPLFPARVTRFAVDVVGEMGGIWESEGLDNRKLMSVLIPSHVRNPRRVKALINNFVLLYRLARHHRSEGRLSRDPRASYLELAKLVALRTEFPLFARDLTVSSRLPRLLLQMADGVQVRPGNVPEYLWRRTQEYFHGTRQVAVAIGQDASPTAPRPDRVTSEQAPGIAADAVVDANHEGIPPRILLDESPSRHLIRYLQKTRTIQDPRADFVFLEDRGNLFGLDESTAEQVLDLALDAAVSEMVALIASLPIDEHGSVIRFLTSRAQDAEPGVEGINLLTCLFAACEEVESAALAEVEALQVVTATTVIAGDLRSEWLRGGLRVALAFPERDNLVTMLMRDPRVEASHDLGLLLIEAADKLLDHRDHLAKRWVTILLDSGNAHRAIEAVSGLESRSELLRSASADFRERVRNWSADSQQVFPFQAALEAAAKQGDQETASQLLAALFELGDPDWFSTLASYLGLLNPDADTRVAFAAAIEALPRHAPSGLLATLRALPNGVGALDGNQRDLGHTIDLVWADKDDFLELEGGLGLRHVVDELLRTRLIQVDQEELIDAIVAGVPPVPSDEASLTSALDYLDVIESLLVSDAVTVGAVAAAIASAVLDVVGAPITAASSDQQGRLPNRLEWVAENCSVDAVNDLAKRILTCKWIEKRRTVSVRMMRAAAEAGRHGLRFPLESANVVELVRANPAAQSELASTWLEYFCDDLEDLFAVVSAYRASYGKIRPAIRACARRLTAGERLQLLEGALGTAATMPWGQSYVEDVGAGPFPEPAFARTLVELYGEIGTSNARRRPFFVAWDKAGIQSKQQRKKLVRGVVIPTLEKGGAEGLKLVHSYRHLMASVPGIRRDVEAALRPLKSEKNQPKIDELFAALSGTANPS